MDKVRVQHVKGMLREAILNEIHLAGSIHGYSLIKVIRQKTGVYFGPSTMYPLLRELSNEGLVTSKAVGSWGGGIRPILAYSTTPKGERVLGSSVRDLQLVMQALVLV